MTLHQNKNYYLGNTFVIEVKNDSKINAYVQSATLNGNPLDSWWFLAKTLQQGGTLNIVMGSEPNKNRATGKEQLPPVP